MATDPRPTWHWWAWLAASVVATVLFCRGLPYHDATTFAVLILLPILCLRQAWRAGRRL